MNRHLSWIVIILTTSSISVGCKDRARSYGQFDGAISNNIDERLQGSIASIARSNSTVQEFSKLFSNARHFIYGYSSLSPEWRSESIIYGKYVIVLSFDLNRQSDDDTHLRQADGAIYRIVDVSSAIKLDDGRIELRYGPINNRILTRSEWNLLVKNKGDFNRIGISLVTDSPIPLFEDHYDNVKLGGY